MGIALRELYSGFGCRLILGCKGLPVADAEVRVATGWATLLGGGTTRTDADGNYELHFGPGITIYDEEGANLRASAPS